MISIIVPVYNVEDYLHKCIDSIRSQKYVYFELILVDDGSTDASGRLCDELASSDSRIRVIHKKNGGLSSARNVGLDVARGEYIVFIDSDDFVNEDYLQKLLHSITCNNADIAICGFLRVNNDEHCISGSNFTFQEVLTAQECLNYYFNGIERTFFVVAWNKIYKRNVFDKLRFPVGRVHEDVYVFHELFAADRVISVVFSQLYSYRLRNNSITAQVTYKKLCDSARGILGRCLFFKETKQYYFLQRSICDLMHILDNIRNEDNDIDDQYYLLRDDVRKILVACFLRTKEVIFIKYYFRVAFPNAHKSIKKLWLRIKHCC